MLLKKVLPLAIMALSTAPALATEATETSLPKWGGGAELGAIWTAGNTDTSSINGKFAVKREGTDWVSSLNLTALSSEDEEKTTKEKYTGQIQLDRKLSEHSYIAAVIQQDRDRFSGFEYQGTASVGYGYRAIKSENMDLAFEAGPGYYREHVRDTHEINEEAIGRIAMNYQWTIREGVSFIEEAVAEMGSDNQTYRSETGLKSQINGSLATKLTYKIKHVAEVPEDTKKTDSEFGVTLVYSF